MQQSPPSILIRRSSPHLRRSNRSTAYRVHSSHTKSFSYANPRKKKEKQHKTAESRIARDRRCHICTSHNFSIYTAKLSHIVGIPSLSTGNLTRSKRAMWRGWSSGIPSIAPGKTADSTLILKNRPWSTNLFTPWMQPSTGAHCQ